MAYRHYAAFGQTPDPKYPEGSEDPKYPAAAEPGPSDLMVALPPGTPLPGSSLPPPFIATPSQVVPLPPMTSSSTQTPLIPTSQSGKIISADGLFGVQWKWWVLGGIAVAVVRSMSGGAKVVQNARRRGRRSR